MAKYFNEVYRIYGAGGRKPLTVNRLTNGFIEIFIGEISQATYILDDCAGIDNFTVRQMHGLGRALLALKEED